MENTSQEYFVVITGIDLTVQELPIKHQFKEEIAVSMDFRLI